MSYRQAKRIRKAVELKRAKGVVHGNVGRPPPNRVPEAFRQQVLQLSQKTYREVIDTHFTEKLAEREGIGLRGRKF